MAAAELLRSFDYDICGVRMGIHAYKEGEESLIKRLRLQHTRKEVSE